MQSHAVARFTSAGVATPGGSSCVLTAHKSGYGEHRQTPITTRRTSGVTLTAAWEARE
jgi:hypothetical protein